MSRKQCLGPNGDIIDPIKGYYIVYKLQKGPKIEKFLTSFWMQKLLSSSILSQNEPELTAFEEFINNIPILAHHSHSMATLKPKTARNMTFSKISKSPILGSISRSVDWRVGNFGSKFGKSVSAILTSAIKTQFGATVSEIRRRVNTLMHSV